MVIKVTVYPKKYAHGFCFAVLCCGYTLADFPISIRLTSLALWQSNDCPSASKATLMNMDKYFMWIHYERLHNHNKAKHNKTVCIFLGIYCSRFFVMGTKYLIGFVFVTDMFWLWGGRVQQMMRTGSWVRLWLNKNYRKTSNISRTLVGNTIVDNSDVVGASPVGAAPTTSSFST